MLTIGKEDPDAQRPTLYGDAPARAFHYRRQRFRALRLSLGLSQRSAAALLHVAQPTINRWERGVAPVPPNALASLLQYDYTLDQDTLLLHSDPLPADDPETPPSQNGHA